jgi:hypothetical protein
VRVVVAAPAARWSEKSAEPRSPSCWRMRGVRCAPSSVLHRVAAERVVLQSDQAAVDAHHRRQTDEQQQVAPTETAQLREQGVDGFVGVDFDLGRRGEALGRCGSRAGRGARPRSASVRGSVLVDRRHQSVEVRIATQIAHDCGLYGCRSHGRPEPG